MEIIQNSCAKTCHST